MNIHLEGKDIELKYTFRSMIIYEKIMGQSFSPKGITEILVYFYSTILASNKDVTLTYESFIDWLDENPAYLTEFSQWLNNTLSRNSYISQVEESEVDPKKAL